MQENSGKHEDPHNEEAAGDEAADHDPQPARGGAVGRHLAKTKEKVFSPEAKGLTKGFLQYYLHQAKEVLTNPNEFFEHMPKEGDVTEPLIFLGISATIYGLIEAIAHLNPILFFTSVFSSLFSTYVGSYIVSFALQAMGGKGSQPATFRVLAFSKATLLFAWINVANFAVGGFAALGYTVYLNILGLKKVHGAKATAVVVILLALLGFAMKQFLNW